MMTMKDLQDGRRFDVGMVVPLKIEADSNGAVAALFPNAKNQRHDLRWNTKADVVRSPRQIPKTSYAVLLIAFLPDVEERPRYSEKAAGLADVAAMRCACCSMRSLAFTFLAWICS